MKTFKQKDKFFSNSIIVLVFILGLFIAYLFSFVFADIKTKNSSNIETLNKAGLTRINSLLDQRKDVDTNGKPDIDSVDIGNEEPFR